LFSLPDPREFTHPRRKWTHRRSISHYLNLKSASRQ
jgi:hypothetical protein